MALVTTGYKIYTKLKERRLDTLEFTGEEKVNDISDPDYVAKVYDTNTCPILNPLLE